jgi:transposase
MKTSKFTDERIAMALRQADPGTPVGEICRKLGVSDGCTCDFLVGRCVVGWMRL